MVQDKILSDARSPNARRLAVRSISGLTGTCCTHRGTGTTRRGAYLILE